MNYRIEKSLSNLLFILILFPYISPINTNFDTQPYALLFSGVIIFFSLLARSDKTSKHIWKLLFLLIISIFNLIFLSTNYLNGLRSVGGYATLFFVSFAAYKTFKFLTPKILLYAAYLWLFVGLVQTFVSTNFGDFLLPRMSTSVSRGVTSLAVEPSYYAIMMIFMLLINEYFITLKLVHEATYKKTLVICSIQILMSLSGMGIMLLGIFIVAKILSLILTQDYLGKIKAIVAGVVILFTGGVLIFNVSFLANSRGGLLLKKILINPTEVIDTDVSFSQRLSHILVPLFSLIPSWGMGYGLGNFTNSLSDVLSEAPYWLLNMFRYITIYGGRIMSGWGSSIFELGIFGFIPMIILVQLTLGNRNKNLRQTNIFSFITLFLLMWNAVPYSLPIFAYIIGMLSYFKIFSEKLYITKNKQ